MFYYIILISKVTLAMFEIIFFYSLFLTQYKLISVIPVMVNKVCLVCKTGKIHCCRAFKEKLLPFCPLHTSLEHENFVENVMTQRKLSRRLAELLRYRRFGITKFNELVDFEKQKMIRQSPTKTVSISEINVNRGCTIRPLTEIAVHIIFLFVLLSLTFLENSHVAVFFVHILLLPF